MNTEALVYFLVFLGGMVLLAALAGAGDALERRSGRFSRWLDRVVGRPDGWR